MIGPPTHSIHPRQNEKVSIMKIELASRNTVSLPLSSLAPQRAKALPASIAAPLHSFSAYLSSYPSDYAYRFSSTLFYWRYVTS